MAQQSKEKIDNILLFLFLIAIIWGLFTCASVSIPYSIKKYGTGWHYALHQLLFGVGLGIAAGLFFFKVKIEYLKKISALLFGINLILLFLVFFPKISAEINGARRWLKIGPLFLQPAEFLKLSFLIYLSAWFSSKGKQKSRSHFKWQVPFVFLTVLSVLAAAFAIQRDLSSLVIIGLAGTIIYFFSRAPWWQVLIIGLIESSAAWLFIKSSPYRTARVLAFLHPQSDPLGKGYQLKQSLIAIGSGKIFGIDGGLSLGLSRQKFGFLSQPMTDSIFSVIGEELGFIGACFLILLFLLIGWRALKIASASHSSFGKLLAAGIGSWIVFQAFFNIAGTIGISPLAGIPLPFFSYGSSHLLIEFAAAGILLNLSKNG